MNDLGWTLAWLAAQVAALMVPAIGLQALASRRGPASGAWVASLSLGMVILLGVLAFAPGLRRVVPSVATPASRSSVDRPGGMATVDTIQAAKVGDGDQLSIDPDPLVARFRRAWSRLEQRAAGPVARFRPWGKALTLATLAGSGVGLIRLLIGLWAVGLCRSRGQLVDDPALVGLVTDLRLAMGCERLIELREVADLATPATAGWHRPMLLLPGNWRGWDEPERRAVVAHELAHILRGDYASGLLARVAVVLNWYHPLVRWMAARLHFEQELAADALGAQFAGGPTSYLLALSRLALKQDGRPSSWPARAFLPTRGTLIRRIKMLRDENPSKKVRKTWSKPMRLATVLGLLALTIGLASWKAPASAQEYKLGTLDGNDVTLRVSHDRAVALPFEVSYLPENMPGVVACRPSEALKKSGMAVFRPVFEMWRDEIRSMLAIEGKVDPSRPALLKLGLEEIESVVSGVDIRSYQDNKLPKGKQAIHQLMFSGTTVRTVAPFDWLAFMRQWNIEPEEVRQPRGTYYRIKGALVDKVQVNYCLFMADDRTIVFDEEARIKAWVGREVAEPPAYLRGPDWERASRGLFALAFNNQGGSFAKSYDLGRPDDPMVLSMLKGVERWVLGLADTDAITLRAEATTTDPQAAEALAQTIDVLRKLSLMGAEGLVASLKDHPDSDQEAKGIRMYHGLLTRLKPESVGPSVVLRAEDFGTFGDAAAVYLAAVEAKNATFQKAAEAKAKTEKR